MLGDRLFGRGGAGHTAPHGQSCREQKGRTNIPFGKAFPAPVQGKPSHFTGSKTEPLNTKQARDKLPPPFL